MLWHFFCFWLASSFEFHSYHTVKLITKKQNKKFYPDSSSLAPLKAGQGNRLTVTQSLMLSMLSCKSGG